ncbi:MAG: hypothetical protein M9909_03010 [Thermomicrobiales bacterium]|nr:hypothetical protein [Thermomicrobiales bacterium]
MARRGIPIKTLLLDQSFIAGLGNIYVDEVLWRVRVHPATPECGQYSEAQCDPARDSAGDG